MYVPTQKVNIVRNMSYQGFLSENRYLDPEGCALLDPVSVGADHENNLVPVQHNRVRSAPINGKNE